MKNSKDLSNSKEISDGKKRRKKKKVWWKTTLYVLMMTVLTIVSLLLIFNKQVGYQITDYTVRHTSKIKGEKLEPTYDMSQVKPYSAEAAVQAATEAQTTGVRAAGQVSIPSVGINLPVYEGVNNVHLYLGAAETRPRSEIQPGQEGNYTIASHYIDNRGSLFEPLPRTKVGDKVYMAFNDKVYEYTVEHVERITTDDETWLEDKPGEKLMTLYSCVSIYLPDERWVVQGSLTNEYDLRKESDVHILSVFQSHENTLKGTYLESYEYLRPQ